ncbi:cytochrome C [Longibacter salinarum]|uniref:Cytochrome C n=1 Tax=Longibacter salinarum TaxID=1850348 RepID=A0A2A8CX56_9BACT|nr:cytochrome c [Longibacter salinarum]PEN13200.1 cytochrome C [Longibacter salinarum]
MPDESSTPPESSENARNSAADEGARSEASSPEPIDMLAPLFREQSLPPEGMEAPPMWLWMVIFGVVLFSTFYLGHYTGDFSPDPWLQSSDPVVATTTEPEEVEVDGAQIYSSRCATCHQSDGEGISGAFPPLNQAEWVTGDKGQIIRILLQGMIGEVEVRGNVYNGNMPAWGNQLSDQEIAAVITHVRQSWDNSASEVTGEEVQSVRSATEGRVQAWTAEELQQPENMGVGDVEDDAGTSNDTTATEDATAALRFMRGDRSGERRAYASMAQHMRGRR